MERGDGIILSMNLPFLFDFELADGECVGSSDILITMVAILGA